MKEAIKLINEQLSLDEPMLRALERKFETGKYSLDLPIALESKRKKVASLQESLKILKG